MIKVHRNSKGFTLIELLIVIAIIGILAAIAIPAYTGYTKKAKLSGVTSAMGALKNAITAYYTEKGNIPSNPTSITEINSNFGITLPSQYVSDANVTNASDIVTINVTLANIGSDVNGGVMNLVSTNIATTPTWTFGSANANITPLLPK
ncbi:MAG: pilin [Proteobacteria bacterium]|nr:pilin [Pseudomonadota bacterium]